MKLKILPLLFIVPLLVACDNEEPWVEYTHEEYMALLTKRSIEPNPYKTVDITTSIDGGKKDTDTYEQNAFVWKDEFDRTRIIDTVTDDTFSMLFFEEAEIEKCHFYAREESYWIKGKGVSFEGKYLTYEFTAYTFEFYYDVYGMPTKKNQTFILKDSGEKLKLSETFIYK